MMHAMHAMLEDGLTIDEVDRILGRRWVAPKSAAFGTADIVALTPLLHVAERLRESPRGPRPGPVPPAPLVKEMRSAAFWGASPAGLFPYGRKGENKRKYVLDYNTSTSRPSEKVSFPSLEQRRGGGRGGCIPEVISGNDKAAKYAWKVSPIPSCTLLSGSPRSRTTSATWTTR